MVSSATHCRRSGETDWTAYQNVNITNRLQGTSPGSQISQIAWDRVEVTDVRKDTKESNLSRPYLKQRNEVKKLKDDN